MGLLKSLAPIAGAVVGNMIAPGIGGQIGGALAGGLVGGSPNVSGAYGGASAQQQQAYQNAQFRPVGVTTTYGQSKFEVDPNTGQLKSAGYTLVPELQGLQSSLLGGFGGALQQAQGVDTTALNQGAQSLFNLGQGYLSESPEAARQRYISQQQALLAPENEQTLAGIRNKLFQTGRTGLATGGTAVGNMAATNPELAAYYNALAKQQSQLTANAETAAQQQVGFGQDVLKGGAGLLSTGYGLQTAAYDPLKTQLGIGSYIEDLGAKSLGIGSELGGRASTAGAQAGQLANAAAITGLSGQIAQQGIDTTRQTDFQNQLTGLLSNQKVQQGLGSVGSSIGNWFDTIISPTPQATYSSYNPSVFGGGDNFYG